MYLEYRSLWVTIIRQQFGRVHRNNSRFGVCALPKKNCISYESKQFQCVGIHFSDNLPRLDIITERKFEKAEGKKLVANLLYFVPTWDQEFVSGLTSAIEKKYFSNLTDHIRDIVECRTCNV